MTPAQEERVTKEWSKIAGEPITVELVRDTMYAHGSELACLRLFRAFRHTAGANALWSENLGTWLFALPVNLGTAS